MTMKMLAQSIMFGLAVLGGAVSASAQSDRSNIQGNWTFVTDIGPSCGFEGTAIIAEALDGGLTCEITAHQACPADGSGSSALVRQSCTIDRTGNKLTLISTIEEFLGGTVTTGYQPDNFYLLIISSDKMEGYMSSIGEAPSVWTRDEGSTS